MASDETDYADVGFELSKESVGLLQVLLRAQTLERKLDRELRLKLDRDVWQLVEHAASLRGMREDLEIELEKFTANNAVKRAAT